MRNDLDCTFGEIFDDDFVAFQNQLLAIQKFRKGREDSEQWVQHLRFLDISSLPDAFTIGDVRLPKRLRASHAQDKSSLPHTTVSIPIITRELGNICYIAVSWRWTVGWKSSLPHGHSAMKTFDYRIRRPGRKPHKSDFPDHYLERVIRFAQSVDIPNVWIDKESIYQREGDENRHPNDKDLGVQIMDVVYGSSAYSVALLNTALVHQSEIDLLWALLSRSIFVDANDKEIPELTDNNVHELQILILRILSDDRWSRGWIFQEDHLSSDRMVLLIPHAKLLEKENYFGTIPGELQVNLADFRQAVTMFCMACGEESRWPASEILGKAKQYNIWNRKVYRTEIHPHWKDAVPYWTDTDGSGWEAAVVTNYANISLFPSTTLSILDDICHRNLFKEEDRIAIMANAAKFAVRLDISEDSKLVQPNSYSLSTALLALILLNGEILATDITISSADVLRHTLRSYLEKCQYKFNAPNLKFEQSMIDHFRFRSPTITAQGLRVKGFLFRLLPGSKQTPLRFSRQDRENIRILHESPKATRAPMSRKLSKIAEKVIEILVRNLERCYEDGCPLADFLLQYLELDRHPPPLAKAEPSTSYITDMLSALVQALLDGRDIRLARLEDEDETSLPSAIFIPPLQQGVWANDAPGEQAGRSCTFTSWDNGWRGGNMERLASMEVTIINRKVGSTAMLRTIGWVNGVWDVRGKSMDSYTFPLPGITNVA